VLRTPPTTAASIAVGNLNAQIADGERRSRAGGIDADAALVDLYAMRARFVGRVADLAAADRTSARLVAVRPDQPGAHLARARALSGIHELGAAQDELETALRLGADAEDVAREKAALLLAMGREDEAARAWTARPRLRGGGVDTWDRPGARVGDWVMAAGIAARLGAASESNALFEAARESYRDVSPFTVAWVDFERARALELRGDWSSAKAYLAEAVDVLPCYAHAVVHLAALEPPVAALRLLGGVDSTSDDPDVLAAEADALRRAGRRAEASETAARARTRFEEVVATLPRAYADHAASFYLGMGDDAGRALALARANAENRATSEAQALWLTAAMAAGARGEACAAARARVEHPSMELVELREVAGTCR
jgi:tetratricopeptide (TPR) repeat protein